MIKLEETDLFEGISAETLEVVRKEGRVVTYERNQICFRAKDNVDNIYVMLEGKAAVYNLTHTGRRKTIFYLGEGRLLNDQITPGTYPSVFCESVCRSLVFVLSSRILLERMMQDPVLMANVIRVLEKKLFRMSHQLKNTLGGLERKLAAKIWKLGRDFGVKTERGLMIDLSLSITDLADFLGAPRETTSRICKMLNNRGLIEIENKKIYILSPDKLSYFYKHTELSS